MKNKILYFYISKAGFGNKIFNIIIALYFKNKYNFDLHTKYERGKHNKNIDPEIFDIFPLLKKYMIFSDNLIISDSIPVINGKKISSLKKIDYLVKNKNIIRLEGKAGFYKFINYIYDSLPNDMKEIFNVNPDLINLQLSQISKTDYACIHIRYGDKLEIISSEKSHNAFLVYTPDYYINIISLLIKKNIKVYIITDTKKVVDEFILKNINSNLVELLDIPYWSAFYLLYNSKYLIMSHSSFSIAAKLFEKKKYMAVIAERPAFNKAYIPEDSVIRDKNFQENTFIINNKNVILNYNKSLAKKMYDFLLS